MLTLNIALMLTKVIAIPTNQRVIVKDVEIIQGHRQVKNTYVYLNAIILMKHATFTSFRNSDKNNNFEIIQTLNYLAKNKEYQ